LQGGTFDHGLRSQSLERDAGANLGRSEAKRLETRITEAQSFDELVDVHRSMTFDYTGKQAAQGGPRVASP
jgi:hypothetical protein